MATPRVRFPLGLSDFRMLRESGYRYVDKTALVEAVVDADAQVMLLRALETGRVQPMGADREVEVDVRLVAATHRDLAKRVRSGEFRDFVVTRIEAPTLVDEEPNANERPDNDIQWTRIVELDLVPHPRLNRPEIIRMDYGMKDGSIRMHVRAAVAGYMLQRWSVDASPDHSLTGHEYRLWLRDHLALYGVKNALLAPGYRSPMNCSANWRRRSTDGMPSADENVRVLANSTCSAACHAT